MSFVKCGLGALFGIFAVTTLDPVSARASTTRDDQPDSGYVTLGASPDYAAVGTFVNSWGYAGAGTLIAPDWVLTAAHMLTAASSGTFTIGGTAYTATQLIRHPGWTGNSFGGNDFGLVHLSSSVAAIPPAILYPGSAEVGQTATFVGLGFTGTGLTGKQYLDNQKRAFQNIIDGDLGNPSILLVCDFDNPRSPADSDFGDPNPLALEGCVAPGDSGGGVFILDGTQSYLAGVISFVASSDGNSNSDYGDISGFGRVSAFVPWVMTTIPEPSTSLLLAGAGLTLFFGRGWRNNK